MKIEFLSIIFKIIVFSNKLANFITIRMFGFGLTNCIYFFIY